MANKSDSKSLLWSSCLGNFFEHYDTALFGVLSMFLAPLIFPHWDPITALLLTYAMIPLGMIARPVGSLIFGYIGNVYGRRLALFLSLGGMSIVSGIIALTPTYAEAGILAPLMFIAGRVLQNLLAAGEVMGGAIFLLENSPKQKQDLLSGIFNASTIGGILLASAGVSFLSQFQAVDWGWRMLYLIGCLTGLFAFVIRRMLPANTWDAHSGVNSESFSMQMHQLWLYRKQLLYIAVCAGFGYACYTIALVLMNGFVPLISSYTKEQMVHLNTALTIFDFCALPFFGWLCSKVSRERVMMGASLCIALMGIPLIMLLPQASLISTVLIRASFVTFGVAFFAPFHAWAKQLVIPEYRYGVISFGYALGVQVLGAPTPFLSLWAYQKTGTVSAIGWYWTLLALATFVVLYLSKQTQPADLLQEERLNYT